MTNDVIAPSLVQQLVYGKTRVRLISRQRGGLAVLKLTKLFGIDDFPAPKDSGKVLIIIIYGYLIIVTIIIIIRLL